MGGLALERRRDMAIRGALGAQVRYLANLLTHQAAPVAALAIVMGAATGATGLLLAHATWPGPAGVDARLVVGLPLVALLLTSVASLPLIMWPARFAARNLGRLLTTGERVTPGRLEGGARRLAIGAQLTVTLALLSGGFGLLWSTSRQGTTLDVPVGDSTLMVIPVATQSADRDWSGLLDQLADIPAIRPESIASLGGWLGLGTRDFALAHCGRCSIGGLPIEMLGEVAHHHAVSPGFFGSAGQPILAGRDFAASDDRQSDPVAIVSSEFARRNFQNGEAVGRQMRIGAGDRWYLVVGIVEDVVVPALGREALPAPSIYVALSQHAPDRGEIALRIGRDVDVAVVTSVLEQSGFHATGPLQPMSAYRGAAIAPLRWEGRSMAAAALLCLIVAVQSAYALARAEAATRRREMAIRLSLGSSRARVVAEMLRKAGGLMATCAFWAIPGATAVAAAISDVSVGVSAAFYVSLCGVLTAAVTLGTLGPALDVARVPPAEVLG
jgi:putative ABC transport system permease protein